MARYIDADELNDEYYDLYYHGTIAVRSVLSVFVSLLQKQPTADVVEVKHGEWITFGLMNPRCSLCKRYSFEKANYCPNCGAKMDGERKEK